MDENTLENDHRLSFDQVLDAVLDGESVQISQLFRLSDMQSEEFEKFGMRWVTTDEIRRAEIARHLADISEENFAVEFSPVFKLCLADNSDAVKIAALDGLWDSTNVNMVRPIIDLMELSSNVEVRTVATRTLAHFVLLGEWGQISSYVKERIVTTLLKLYNNRETPDAVRCAALEALGASSEPSVPSLIEEAFEDGNFAFQVSALFAMGNSADKRWLSTVIGELESPYEQIRAEAARAAGEIGSSDAIPQLAELSFDEDDEVQLAAIHALGKIGGDAASRILNQFLEDDELEMLQEAIEESIEQIDFMGEGINFDKLDWEDDL